MGANKVKPRGGRPGASVKIPSTTDRRELTEVSTLSLDRDLAERFLTALDPEATFWTFQTFDDDRDRKSKSLVRVLHGTLDEHWDTLERLNGQGAGIFVTVSETDGKGRTGKNIVRVRSLFLDLDGAPLEPVLANGRTPHIVVESSAKRWHTYWRVTHLPLDQFTQLQKSLIEQFGGDKSVHDLPRVMRLPGFLHRKGEPFLSHIVSTSKKTKLYTVADFPAVEVKKKVSDKKRAERSKQDQSKWQKLNSAALAKLEAWVPELLPEAKPYHDGYRVTSASLRRDLEEDLSLMPQGIKDFGVHDLGDAKEGRRTPLDVVMEWGGKTLVEASLWLRNKIGLPEEGVSLEDFRAYMPQHNYFFTPSREPWPASSVNARMGSVKLLDNNGNPQLDDDGKPKTISASAWLDTNRPVEQVTWAPGEPMLIQDRLIVEAGWIERAGVAILNLYRPPTIVPGDPQLAGMWIDLAYKVFLKEDGDHFIKWCAQRVQTPQIKINHALVIGSDDHGIGKDSLLEGLRRAVGPYNVKEVTPQTLLGRFNGYLQSVVMRCNEARDLGEMTRYQFYDHTKAYTASPPDTLSCDEKNVKEHHILNCTGVIITTNHKTDGIYLPPEDRRHYVAWSERVATDFEEGYWTKFWNWLNDGGDRHVAAYLATFDLSSFDPKAPPPKTDAFWEIVNSNRTPEDSELADAIDRLENPKAITIIQIADGAKDEELKLWIKDRRNRRVIPHRLGKCGYVPVRSDTKDGLWKISGARQAIYALKELSPGDRLNAAQELVDKAKDM